MYDIADQDDTDILDWGTPKGLIQMEPVEGDTDEEGEELDNMFPFTDEDVANMFGDEDEPDEMLTDKVDDLESEETCPSQIGDRPDNPINIHNVDPGVDRRLPPCR